MFDGRWRNGVDRTTGPIGQALHRHGITADVLTATGLVSATATAALVATGHLHLAIIMLIITGLHDLLDGPVAKAAGTASVRGAFFDSVTDRVADAVLMFGASWYLISQGDGHLALLPMAILGVTSLISYERAKAESLGLQAKGGLMERGERMFLFGVGLLSAAIFVPRRRPLRQGVERCLGPRRRHPPTHRGLARGPGGFALAGLARVTGDDRATPPGAAHPHHRRCPGRPLAGAPAGGARQPLGKDTARATPQRARPARRQPAPPDGTSHAALRARRLLLTTPRRPAHRT